MDTTISDRAADLILGFEGFAGRPTWPGGASGITLDPGYDLGYHSIEEFTADWKEHLPAEAFERLTPAIGLQGAVAKGFLRRVADIRINRAVAEVIFLASDLPRWIQRTGELWPCYDSLGDDAQGALVSLTFNRGTGMGKKGQTSWDSRKEMREIRDVLKAWCGNGASSAQLPDVLDVVAGEVRSMKRLWVDQGLDGLITRREAEAKLLESAAAQFRALASTRRVRVVASVLNVRTLPSTGSSVIASLRTGDSVPLLQEKGDWRQVQLSDGRSGWVFSQYTAAT